MQSDPECSEIVFSRRAHKIWNIEISKNPCCSCMKENCNYDLK